MKTYMGTLLNIFVDFRKTFIPYNKMKNSVIGLDNCTTVTWGAQAVAHLPSYTRRSHTHIPPYSDLIDTYLQSWTLNLEQN